MSKDREFITSEEINKEIDETEDRKYGKFSTNIFALCISLTVTGTFILSSILYKIHNTRKNEVFNREIEEYQYEEILNENELNPSIAANLIETSNNPDLAVWAFCETYEKENPEFVDQTIRLINFEYNDANINNLSYINFLELNKLYSQNYYTNFVKNEVYDDYKNDREVELDNLNVRVKKKILRPKSQNKSND